MSKPYFKKLTLKDWLLLLTLGVLVAVILIAVIAGKQHQHHVDDVWAESLASNQELKLAVATYRECKDALMGTINYKAECAQSAFDYAKAQSDDIGSSDKKDFFQIIEDVESKLDRETEE